MPCVLERTDHHDHHTRTPPVQQQLPVRAATGVLDIDANGKGHLRAESMLPLPSDLQVSPR